MWNQLGKLKISCTWPVKERQKFVSELCIGRNKTECAWQAGESHEAVIDSSQHTSITTCTAAPRVWHFSAFHFPFYSYSQSTYICIRINTWISDTSMKHVWAPPLAEAQRYSTSNLLRRSKYAMNNIRFLFGTATYITKKNQSAYSEPCFLMCHSQTVQ